MDLFQLNARGPAIDLEDSGFGRSCCPGFIPSGPPGDRINRRRRPLLRREHRDRPGRALDAEQAQEAVDRPERVPGDGRIRYYDFGSRASTIVARGLGDIAFGITASRDGRAILYARRDSAIDDLMLVDNFR